MAGTLEALCGLAASRGHLRARPGPRDAALREARVCYDHLAGAAAVRMFDHMAGRGYLRVRREEIALSESAEAFLATLGLDLSALTRLNRPLCRVCLDWSERRSHLSGALGAALLERFRDLGWLRQAHGAREVRFTPEGQRRFEALFPAEAPATSRADV